MKLIAREKIIGVYNDEGLRALDGYAEFVADTNDENELIDLFEKANPTFRAESYEIRRA